MAIGLKVILTSLSPIHIGAESSRAMGATRPLLIDPVTRLPYIPSTTIKGRLRNAVESFLCATNVRICEAPLASRMCQPSNDSVCPVCALFGSPWRESRLYFSDLHLDATVLRSAIPTPRLRAGIRVNRRRGVVESQFLFNTEIFEPGIPWKYEGQIDFEGEVVELVPLYLAVRDVTMIGGSRSRGLGWCTLSLPTAPTSDELRVLWETWRKGVGA